MVVMLPLIIVAALFCIVKISCVVAFFTVVAGIRMITGLTGGDHPIVTNRTRPGNRIVVYHDALPVHRTAMAALAGVETLDVIIRLARCNGPIVAAVAGSRNTCVIHHCRSPTSRRMAYFAVVGSGEVICRLARGDAAVVTGRA